jgi:hypothetical protein
VEENLTVVGGESPKYQESVAQKTIRENNFTYHPPKEGQPERYSFLRMLGDDLARRLNENCPPSRELSLAMTHLEQVIFFANAAIARNE